MGTAINCHEKPEEKAAQKPAYTINLTCRITHPTDQLTRYPADRHSPLFLSTNVTVSTINLLWANSVRKFKSAYFPSGMPGRVPDSLTFFTSGRL